MAEFCLLLRPHFTCQIIITISITYLLYRGSITRIELFRIHDYWVRLLLLA